MNILTSKSHLPVFLICIGSVFALPSRLELSFLTCNIIAEFGVLAIIFVFVLESITNKKWLPSKKTVLQAFYYVGLIEMTYAILQFIGIVPSLNCYFSLTGSFCSPVLLSMFLSLCIPIGIYFSFNDSGITKIGWASTSYAMFILLLATDSRTGMIALTCSIIILSTENKYLRKIIFRKWFVIGAILIIGILGFLLYYYKPDSVKGRLLIWNITLNMISERPLCGWGRNGFEANYMLHQAQYFFRNPSSEYLLLADNTNNPYNEFLYFSVEYGIIATILLIFIIIGISYNIARNINNYKSVYLSLFVTIIIWAIFSYPLKASFVWIVLTYIIICTFENQRQFKIVRFLSFCLLPCCILYFLSFTYINRAKIQWLFVQEASLAGRTKKMIPQYKLLINKLGNNADFLYNYSAELNYIGYYEESNKILSKCTEISNDYNVQMLMADNYRHMGWYKEALNSCKIAGWMIPSRFLPLYYEMQIYDEAGKSLLAYQTAEQIVNKTVKFHDSRTIQGFISYAKEYIQKHKRTTNN